MGRLGLGSLTDEAYQKCRRTYRLQDRELLPALRFNAIMASFIQPLFAMRTHLLLGLIASSLLVPFNAQASENPLDGYSGYTNSYFLPFVNSTGFGPGTGGDVQVDMNIGGIANGDTLTGGKDLPNITVDTGSRGLFFDYTRLSSVITNFSIGPNCWLGTNDLTSSQKVYTGYYVTTSVNFAVTDQNSNRTIATAYIPVLDVTTLGCQSNGSATYPSPVASGTLTLVGGGTLSFTNKSFTLTGNEEVSYTNSNNHGLLPTVDNFGIGIGPGTNGGSISGPIGNNTNQIYNALLNLTNMNKSPTNGGLVAGYVLKNNGIQLGLTQSTTNFAYTKLQTNGFTSTNSVPDWSLPTGEIVANGVTNGPAKVLMDTGIGYSFLSIDVVNGWHHHDSNTLSINLLNSAGAVGYNFSTDSNDSNADPSNLVAPNLVTNNGSSDLYINTGRNVFNAFDQLYDGQNGYMGLITNGLVTNDVSFAPGYYPSPVPEPSTYALLGLGILLTLGALRNRTRTN